MCSIRCRNSASNKCTCECQGVYHGVLTYQTPGEHERLLSKMHPPCTPVRFKNPTMRGTTEGLVEKFRVHGCGVYVVLQGQNHELVNLRDYEFGKINENNKNTNARTDG